MAFFGSARIIITGEQENIDGALALLRSFPRLRLCDVNTQEKKRNPYTPVKEAAVSLAEAIGVFGKKVKKTQSSSEDFEAGEQRADAYRKWLEITDGEYRGLLGEKAALEKEIAEHLSARKTLARFEGKKIDFDKYKNAQNFVMRIGRMPKRAYKRLLKICRDDTELLLSFASVKKKTAYITYLCPVGAADRKSALLAGIGFEPLDPSYIKGTPRESLESIEQILADKRVALQNLGERIKEFCQENREGTEIIFWHLDLSERHFEDREKADIKNGTFTIEVILKGTSRRKIAKRLSALGCEVMPKNDRRR